jgi:putative membrane protein
MESEADGYCKATRGIALLWTTVLIGPVAWFLHQQVGYGMATLVCSRGGEVGLHAATGVALLITAVSAVIAWRSWGWLGREWTAHGGGTMGRSRFLALGGGLFSVYFFVVIVAQWVPVFFLPPVSVAAMLDRPVVPLTLGRGPLWPRCAVLLPGLMIHPIGIAPGASQAGGQPTPLSLWHAWNLEPAGLVGLSGLALLYACGVRQLWRRAGAGRGLTPWQAAAFGGGWLALIIAFVSPLDALSARLFSAHMVQHALLMLIAAPLLVIGQPLVGLLRGLPLAWRSAIGRWWCRSRTLRSIWRATTEPLVAWLLHAVALWVWHAPVLYQAALESQIIHLLQHGCFLGSALLFWCTVIHGRQGRMGYGIAVLAIFATAVHSSLLGALITFTPSPWYPAHLETAAAWGLSPLEDQQLAGLIMWVPGGVIYVAAALALFAAWLVEAERRVRQREAPAHSPR